MTSPASNTARVVSKNKNALKTGAPACLESFRNGTQGYTFVP